MKTKTLIDKQLKKKKNPSLVETIIAAKKNKEWLEIASILSKSRRKRKNFNLSEIDKLSKQDEKIAVPGKILSQGEITKKINITALDFSETAREKILNSKSSINYLIEEIKKNPKAQGIKIIK